MNVIAHVSAPSASPLYKRFRSARGEHLLVVPHSRLFDLSPEVAADLDIRPEEAQRLAAALGETGAREAPLDIVVEPSPQSLSLNVSSACNLACGYCYADRGAFGGKQADRMTACHGDRSGRPAARRGGSQAAGDDRLPRRRTAPQQSVDPFCRPTRQSRRQGPSA